jgi:hypothetical protein
MHERLDGAWEGSSCYYCWFVPVFVQSCVRVYRFVCISNIDNIKKACSVSFWSGTIGRPIAADLEIYSDITLTQPPACRARLESELCELFEAPKRLKSSQQRTKPSSHPSDQTTYYYCASSRRKVIISHFTLYNILTVHHYSYPLELSTLVQ